MALHAPYLEQVSVVSGAPLRIAPRGPSQHTNPAGLQTQSEWSSQSVFCFLPMASARWSKGSADRHGVDDDSPRLAHVVADILSLVLMRRGSRSENVTVNKEDFVPVKALLQLVEASGSLF